MTTNKISSQAQLRANVASTKDPMINNPWRAQIEQQKLNKEMQDYQQQQKPWYKRWLGLGGKKKRTVLRKTKRRLRRGKSKKQRRTRTRRY